MGAQGDSFPHLWFVGRLPLVAPDTCPSLPLLLPSASPSLPPSLVSVGTWEGWCQAWKLGGSC